jgi:hypothetical protein
MDGLALKGPLPSVRPLNFGFLMNIFLLKKPK